LAGRVLLLLERLLLDLELHELALDLVDGSGSESISIFSLEAASSTRSMALSGRKRSVM
jgi:hypothetical protein